ncbi:MAG: DUF1343 domain-containing protein [Alistipes sp.]|nr:DUF1343 domain-containing protein [Alistipes sp.]
MLRLSKLLLLLLVVVLCGCKAQAHGSADKLRCGEVLVGATDTASYMPLLRGKRVAVLANHTAMYSEEEHIVDMMHREGINLAGIFAPEHGFRGSIEAGAIVKNSVDERTGVAILSLYTGNKKRPSDEIMRSFDVLVVDMQDVGLRFYTYYITMLQIMDACADFGQRVIVLDRPNPNGHYVDGPILDMKYKSGVGWLPIPVVHGLTMGEIATMALGEGWARPVELTVVKCRNYDHTTHYTLPIAPSPNLPTQHSIYLYPSTCLFEGTVMSLGRGTEAPFEVYGHPDMRGYDFSFTPMPNAGSKTPPHNGVKCYGVDLRKVSDEEVWQNGVNIEYLVDAYRNLNIGDKFFKPVFEKLIGVDYVRQMILDGYSAQEIKARWSDDVERFKRQRKPYLLYAE